MHYIFFFKREDLMRPKKSLQFLILRRLRNWCSDNSFFFFLFFSIRIFWNQTKFPMHKVWRLRETSQIEQTLILLCEKDI